VSGTPIVDVDGNLYLCDTRHLWSYTAAGELRWRTELPVEENGKSYPFITPWFTRTGQVGGVTAAGRVSVFDRNSGRAMPGNEGGYRLPGILGLSEDPDTVETTACADRSGNVYAAHVSSLSSVYSSLYCKLHLDRLGIPLPPPIVPTGGLTLLRAEP
jgi:hypothetical protein